MFFNLYGNHPFHQHYEVGPTGFKTWKLRLLRIAFLCNNKNLIMHHSPPHPRRDHVQVTSGPTRTLTPTLPGNCRRPGGKLAEASAFYQKLRDIAAAAIRKGTRGSIGQASKRRRGDPPTLGKTRLSRICSHIYLERLCVRHSFTRVPGRRISM